MGSSPLNLANPVVSKYFGPRVAITLDERGAIVVDPHTRTTIREAVPSNSRVLAFAGAGDAFLAGFLHAHIQGESLARATTYAIATATRQVAQERTILTFREDAGLDSFQSDNASVATGSRSREKARNEYVQVIGVEGNPDQCPSVVRIHERIEALWRALDLEDTLGWFLGDSEPPSDMSPHYVSRFRKGIITWNPREARHGVWIPDPELRTHPIIQGLLDRSDVYEILDYQETDAGRLTLAPAEPLDLDAALPDFP